jgi:hypothetical protein
MTTTLHIKLLRDKNEVGTFKSEAAAMEYIHRHHSYSLSHALEHEGYSMETFVRARVVIDDTTASGIRIVDIDTEEEA